MRATDRIDITDVVDGAESWLMGAGGVRLGPGLIIRGPCAPPVPYMVAGFRLMAM